MQHIPEIGLTDAALALEAGNVTFVDIRDGGSYAAGHVPGALHLTDRNAAEFLGSADKARRVIVYCYHGHSSMGATGFLLEQGFEDVVSMTGGFTAWRGPVERAPASS